MNYAPAPPENKARGKRIRHRMSNIGRQTSAIVCPGIQMFFSVSPVNEKTCWTLLDHVFPPISQNCHVGPCFQTDLKTRSNKKSDTMFFLCFATPPMFLEVGKREKNIQNNTLTHKTQGKPHPLVRQPSYTIS